MLTATERARFAKKLVGIYEGIETTLLTDIAKRVPLEPTPANIASWHVDKLSEMGGLRTNAVNTIAKANRMTAAEIERALIDAGYKTLSDDEPRYKAAYDAGALKDLPIPNNADPRIQRVIMMAIANTKQAVNMINTSAVQGLMDAYTDVVNQVYLEVATGVTDYVTATQKAVRKLADRGIFTADYVTVGGKVLEVGVDVAIRRSIISELGQMAGKLQIEQAGKWGANHVEVSSHMAARPLHAEWQGKVYCIDGHTDEYPNLADATGYGTAAGLLGVNCRHMFYPFFVGLSEPQYNETNMVENERLYELSQEQRGMERDIRKWKRRVAAEQAQGGDAVAAMTKLAEKQERLREFIGKNKTQTRQYEREYVYAFNDAKYKQFVDAMRDVKTA